MNYETIRYERCAEDVVRITLDRPAVANALNAQLFEELDDAITQLGSDKVRAWILTGAPRPDGRPWFSAGADMKGAGRTTRPRVLPRDVVDRIDDLLIPSIAAVSGMCTTGGLELALACDLRVAAESARFSDWHLKTTGLGIGQWGSAARLSRLVGLDIAKDMLLTGVEMSGRDALRIGLASRCVPDEQLDEASVALASTIASRPPRGVRATLGFLSLQESMSKNEAKRWADLTPELMGLELRPFSDAADRFANRSDKEPG
ncbi:MAG: hypothetical protein JWN62_3392 [Acidimicrobiales bacterium]|nr:hypothetical protein [Acidimicrobiales bacterium]